MWCKRVCVVCVCPWVYVRVYVQVSTYTVCVRTDIRVRRVLGLSVCLRLCACNLAPGGVGVRHVQVCVRTRVSVYVEHTLCRPPRPLDRPSDLTGTQTDNTHVSNHVGRSRRESHSKNTKTKQKISIPE